MIIIQVTNKVLIVRFLNKYDFYGSKIIFFQF